MEIIKRKKNNNFTIISNEILRDKDISLKTKGLYVTIMGLPDTWEFSVSGISAILKEGKTAVYSALAELIEHGYCTRVYLYENKQRAGVEYTFYELKQSIVKLEDLNSGNPNLANQPQLSTNSNKELTTMKEEQPFNESSTTVQFNKGHKSADVDRSLKSGEEEIKYLALKLFEPEYSVQRESLQMKFRIVPIEFLKYSIIKFNTHRRATDKANATMTEYLSHLNNWLGKKDIEAFKKEWINETQVLKEKSINETYGK